MLRTGAFVTRGPWSSVAAQLNRMYAASVVVVSAVGWTIAGSWTGRSEGGSSVICTAQYALPAVYPYREQVASGGLISYGSSISDAWRLAGTYAGRLIKGVTTADFQVPQSSKIQLAINMKTAKALGLTVPTTLLGRADYVIQ